MSDVPHYYTDAALLIERSLSYDYIILVAETPKRSVDYRKITACIEDLKKIVDKQKDKRTLGSD